MLAWKVRLDSGDSCSVAQIVRGNYGLASLPCARGGLGRYTLSGESVPRTIEIDDAMWERLCEKAQQLGCDAEALARSLLADSLQHDRAQTAQLWGEARRLLSEMAGAQSRKAVSENRPVLTPQLVDQWHSLMDRLIQELGMTPEEIEADITKAFEEYRRECLS